MQTTAVYDPNATLPDEYEPVPTPFPVICSARGAWTAFSILASPLNAAGDDPFDKARESKNENAKEWSDEPRASASVCNRSDLDVRGQNVRLRVERAGRQYRRLHHGHEYRRAYADRQGRGRQNGHADDGEPEQEVPLCRHTLAANTRIDLRH